MTIEHKIHRSQAAEGKKKEKNVVKVLILLGEKSHPRFRGSAHCLFTISEAPTVGFLRLFLLALGVLAS